ncbi:MAG: hypothetical protein EOO09_13600 [Chitinophagaceae bacterium]|nr:MAG: hypothetical protein EOO09_13600 [Chitinophagaceae bacterium]
MKYIFFALFSLIVLHSGAQYYYTDLENARILSARAKSLFTGKVKTITATGYDPRGAKTTDYNEIQDVDPGQRSFKVSTRNGLQVSRVTYQFDELFRPLTVSDNSAGFSTTTTYSYNASGNITSIRTSTTDSLNDFSRVEEHQFTWNSAGKPEKLWRILDNRDSIEYRFTLDEKGNVGGEQLFRRNTGFDEIYYYYDEQNRLTDVVRYDKKTKKLLPDFMFEYDEKGNVIQQISTLSAVSKSYLIWRYLFNDKGLKTKEALYDKQKELQGRIDYTYVFYP